MKTELLKWRRAWLSVEAETVLAMRLTDGPSFDGRTGWRTTVEAISAQYLAHRNWHFDLPRTGDTHRRLPHSVSALSRNTWPGINKLLKRSLKGCWPWRYLAAKRDQCRSLAV
jgi:hypothetical protein